MMIDALMEKANSSPTVHPVRVQHVKKKVYRV